MARGIHSRPNNGFTNEWMTPPEVLSTLGEFDLDPCVPFGGQPWKTATRVFTQFEDGLWQKWFGRVWLNPPDGEVIGDWLAKLAKHRNGIALVPARTEVESWFWPYVWDAADAVLFLKGRLYFRTQSGGRFGNAGHGSVLAAYGES